MQFRIEQLFLTDDQGRVMHQGHPSFHVLEAASVEEAVRSFVHTDDATVVGDVLKLPGFQAVATARRNNRVYTLQLSPASDRFSISERPDNRP